MHLQASSQLKSISSNQNTPSECKPVWWHKACAACIWSTSHLLPISKSIIYANFNVDIRARHPGTLVCDPCLWLMFVWLDVVPGLECARLLSPVTPPPILSYSIRVHVKCCMHSKWCTSGARVVHEWCKSVVDGSLEGEMA